MTKLPRVARDWKSTTALALIGAFSAFVLYLWFLRGVELEAKSWPQECSPAQIAQARGNTRQLQELNRAYSASVRRIVANQDGFDLWESPRGRFWLPRGSDHVLPHNLAEQQLNMYGNGGRGVRPGDVVVDCGAHVGLYTRVALDSGARLVVAVEPAPDNLECLRRNLKDEIVAGRVIVYPKGVWDKDDVLSLYVTADNSAADSVVRKYGEVRKVVRVPLTTIDKMVAELGLERVDFIKMDIEGAERQALLGASRTLARFRPRLAVCVYHLPDDRLVIPSLIARLQPAYRAECGPCLEREDGSTQPDVLHFY